MLVGWGDWLFMAVTGLDFSSPTIKQLNHDPAFSHMDRQSIDLNKHAIDLNEVPLNDLSLDLYGASSSHELGSNLLPRKGGWLELFRNMFGQDKMVLDSFPCASRVATLNSSSSNVLAQTSGRAQKHVRIPSTQIVQNCDGISVDQKLDMLKRSVPFASMLQPGKDIRTSKLPMFDEFNHGNILNALPISERSSILAKPLYNAASGQHGCDNDFLNSVYSTPKGANFSGRVGQQECEAIGQARDSNGFHTSSHPISEQGSKDFSISHGFDDYKPAIPFWDLNSQPVPNWSADLQPLAFAKAPCRAGSHLISQHRGKHSTATQAEIIENVKGPCAKVSDVLLTNLRQENALSEQEEDCNGLSMCLEKNGFLCSQKKNCGGSQKNKVSESTSGDVLPLPSSHKKIPLEHRIRIIASPDWLPAGWITEVKTRMAGSTAGTTDKYYKDPVTGRRFRSKNEVFNFLQTGRSCRNKLQFKLLEGFPAVANMPLLLPGQEQMATLSDSLQAEKHTRLTLATNSSSRASVCENVCQPNVILDKILMKYEQDDMRQAGLKRGTDVCRVSDVMSPVESSANHVQERPGLEVLEIQKSDTPMSVEPTSVPMHQEPVHSYKRKSIGDCTIRLPSKHLRSTVKDLQNQDKWIFCVSPFHREAQAEAASRGVEAFDTRIAQNGYPGLLYRQETIGPQDQETSQYLAARYKANARALGLCTTPPVSSAAQVNVGYVKELPPKAVFFNKAVEKKIPKLTLKQERDLFITLGRKLCREFLAPGKETSLE